MSRPAPCEASRKPLSASMSSRRARIVPKAAGSMPSRPWAAADPAPHAGSRDVLALDDLTAHFRRRSTSVEPPSRSSARVARHANSSHPQ